MILPLPSKKLIKKVYENDYLCKKLQPHIGVDSRVRYSKEYRPTVFAEYAMSLEDLGVKPSEVKSILDFGCADGIFLEFCEKYFSPKTVLYGADISKDMLEQAKRKAWNVVHIDDIKKLKKKFDLITLWDVIEHVEAPAVVISSLKKFLNPKGKILLETPRFGVLAEFSGENWPHLLPVQHLSVASKEGMQKLARRTGFKIDRHCSFGANAPSAVIPQPYKKIFDQMAKKLDFGDVQILTLKLEK
ncbi:class I SAM-dependent methyltransferase [Candidatus Nomurabacteria bacterium]|nr:class I SAM-dependent methyltransferase [Candidatus Nomurabacteria bacterium]